MEQTKNKGFGSKIGFVLAAAGSAIGLGNIWKFPYLVGKYGGAAFVLVYIISTMCIGMVALLAEMFLGKRTKTNVVDSFGKVNKKFKWVGMLCVIVPFIISCYYIVVGGWSTKFALNYIFEPNFANGSSQLYFNNFANQGYMPILFTLIFLAIAIMIVRGGVEKGIEKTSKILMPTLFVLLVVLVIKSLSLGDGVSEGLKFYIGKMDFAQLGWDGVVSAMGQSFFSLSIGMGVIIAYGSYSNKKINMAKSTLYIVILDVFVAVFVGFAIFPAMFALGNGTELAQQAGPGLIFVVLPQLFQSMKAGQFFGFIFFSIFIFSAITSVISLLEVLTQYFMHRTKMTRKKSILVVGIAVAIVSVFISISIGNAFANKKLMYSVAGFNVFEYLDELSNTVMIPLMALASTLIVGWGFKKKLIKQEFKDLNSDFKFINLWIFFLRIVTPICIFAIMILGIQSKWVAYNSVGLNFGYVFLGFAILVAFSIAVNIYEDSKTIAKLKYRHSQKNITVVSTFNASIYIENAKVVKSNKKSDK